MDNPSSSDTFAGTAKYYAKYRPEIPTEVVDYLKDKYHLDGSGLLLDIGCGTGISTRAFAPLFSRVIAFDPSKEMLDEAATSSHLPNIDWRLCSDKELDLRSEKVRLAIAVRSFHWLDQDPFLRRLRENMEDDGAIVIIGDGSFWTGEEPWQVKAKEIVQEFLGPDRKAGRGKSYVTSPDPYDVVLKRNGFVDIDMYKIPIIRHWSLNSIIGYLYSTSFSAYHLYDGKNTLFETELKQQLSVANRNREDFVERAEFLIQSARRAPNLSN